MRRVVVETSDRAPKQASLSRRIAAVLIPTFALVLVSFVLPPIPLDGALAKFAVRVSDTGNWGQMPFLCIAALILLTSRPGPGMKRRAIEVVTIIVVMAAAIAGNAVLNERVIKPAFHVPRPNIVALAEQGALGPELPDGAAFYELGDKQDRRDALAPRLAELDEPALAPSVREHWVHETGYSFPSGHSTASMTFASLMLALGLAWLTGWRQHVMRALPVWAVLVVWSRPLLRVHTPVDVTVGTLAGFAWGLLAFVVARAIITKLAPDDASA